MTNQAKLSRVFSDLDRTLIKGLEEEAWKQLIVQPLPFSTDLMTSAQVASELTKLGMLKGYREEEAVKEKRALMEHWYRTLPEEELIFDDTRYFLTELRRDGHSIYLVTTKHEKLTNLVLERLGLLEYFEEKFVGRTSKRQVIESYEGKKVFVTDSPKDMENVRGVSDLICIAVTRDTAYSEEEYYRAGAHHLAKTLTGALYEIRREN